MKNIHQFLMLLTVIGFGMIACEADPDPILPFPDLDPDTEAGADMLIFEIGDTIFFDTMTARNIVPLANNNFTYDLDENGVQDFRFYSDYQDGFAVGQDFSMIYLEFNGQLFDPYDPDDPTEGVGATQGAAPPLYLPEHLLVGTEAQGVWTYPAVGGILGWPFLSGFRYQGPPEGYPEEWFVSAQFPTGKNYLATRSKIGGEWYYGWLEVISTDYTSQLSNYVVISRFGISTEAGIVVRMGQED